MVKLNLKPTLFETLEDGSTLVYSHSLQRKRAREGPQREQVDVSTVGATMRDHDILTQEPVTVRTDGSLRKRRARTRDTVCVFFIFSRQEFKCIRSLSALATASQTVIETYKHTIIHTRDSMHIVVTYLPSIVYRGIFLHR